METTKSHGMAYLEPKTYSEHCQTSTMKSIAKKIAT